MPGSFGNSPTEDGASALTNASDKSGVFGRNNGTQPPPAGSPGGAGVFGLTVVPQAAGVFGANNHPDEGRGVQGNGPQAGVSGFSECGAGLLAHSDQGDGTHSFAHSSKGNALLALNSASEAPPGEGPPAGNGVLGVTYAKGGVGVFGAANGTAGHGIQGNGPDAGVSGWSDRGSGVIGHSDHGDALRGFAHDSARNGILGHNNASQRAPGGGPPAGNGVFGYTDVPNASGVVGVIAGNNTQGAGVTGIGRTAGRFFGNVVVTGDVELTGAGCAEYFEAEDAEALVPGNVLIVAEDGRLQVCGEGYDKRVVGVVSGAGGMRPGVLLDSEPREGNVPITLTGKVHCKIDAELSPIEVGDLLTTSPTPGHAMKADEEARHLGSIIGKALAPLSGGRDLLPVLVSLQ